MLFIVALFFVACQNISSESTEAANQVAETVESAAPKYTLTPFTPSPEFADAAITSMDYKGGTFDFGIGGESYQLGAQTADAEQKMCANSAKGQHIHLIVDNQPYAAKYEAKFDHEVADGERYILAFLSRSYHESIKTAAAHRAIKANVAGGAITASEPVDAPMLFYSRPKGTYVGKANTDKVMLDFYLSNVTLGDDYQVKATINGEEHMVDTWQPYYITGMEMGENTIELALVDKAGNLVEAPLNPVSRTFTLSPDPVESN